MVSHQPSSFNLSSPLPFNTIDSPSVTMDNFNAFRSSPDPASCLNPPRIPPAEEHAGMVSLEKLSNELLQIVIGLVEPNDLPALRLTSRILCADTADAFGETFISVRKHVVCRRSLWHLLAISVHSVFGRFPRTVKLGSYWLEHA